VAPSPSSGKYPNVQVVLVIVLIAVVAGLLTTAFVWPSAQAKPGGLTVAVTGDESLVTAFTEQAGGKLADQVTLKQVSDRDAIVSGVESRDYIGGLVLTLNAPEVLMASAAGSVPAAVMTQIASALQTALDSTVFGGVSQAAAQLQQAIKGLQDMITAIMSGQPVATPTPSASPSSGSQGGQTLPTSLPTVKVTDIVPLSDKDPNGVGLATAGMPLTITALLAGVLIGATVTGRVRRAVAVVLAGAGAAAVGAVVLNLWLGVYPGPFLPVFAVLAVSTLGTSGLFVGLHGLIGLPGFGIGALITLLAGLPWAALAVPYQFLPAHLGTVGQWLVPGATGTLMRNVCYFPNASTWQPWLVLSAWAVLGLVLTAMGRKKVTQ